jgi:SnoaL-like polyketide cyclase
VKKLQIRSYAVVCPDCICTTAIRLIFKSTIMKTQLLLSGPLNISFLYGMILIFLSSCTGSAGSSELQAKVDSLQSELNKFNSEKAMNEIQLARFDSLDFVFYSNQQWDSLAISHDDQIKVYYPDGATTAGLTPQHIDKLKPMFVFAPDTKIKKHPVKFGYGEWTAVIGVMDGTFTQPMPDGKGKTIPPTGKKFTLGMCTIGHWKDGKMIEEWLFWDNQSLLQQIGLAK